MPFTRERTSSNYFQFTEFLSGIAVGFYQMFLRIYNNDHMIFLFLVFEYIDIFLNVKLTVLYWDKPHLIMMCYPL